MLGEYLTKPKLLPIILYNVKDTFGKHSVNNSHEAQVSIIIVIVEAAASKFHVMDVPTF